LSHLSTASSWRPLQPRRPSGSLKPRRRSKAVHVVVEWSPAGESTSTGHVELEAELEASQRPTWTCRQPDDWQWEQALSEASCAEVVLTTRLGDDFAAKGLVFELAERLTHKLAKTQPLIVVRFLPRSGKHA
jgi:hypothetical protein